MIFHIICQFTTELIHTRKRLYYVLDIISKREWPTNTGFVNDNCFVISLNVSFVAVAVRARILTFEGIMLLNSPS